MNDGQATEAPAINQTGESAPGPLPSPTAATLAAGEQALSQHNAAGAGGKKRGRPIIHGAYAGRKRPKPQPAQNPPVPVAAVDNGSGALLVEETFPPAAEIGTEAIEPEFAEAINREYAELAVELLATLVEGVRRGKIIKRTGNEEFANLVIEKTRLSGTAKKSMQTGAFGMAKKYRIDMGKTPEGIFFGGLLVWISETRSQTNALLAKYEELRPPVPVNGNNRTV